MAWENVTMEKLGGGLDLTDFHNTSKALKYGSMMKLLTSYDTEWVHIAHELMRKRITKGRWSKEMKSWTTQEFLLVSSEAHIPSS